MFSQRQIAFAKQHAQKLLTIDGWRKLAKNPARYFVHIKSFLRDSNLADTNPAETVMYYDRALAQLAHWGRDFNNFSVEEWLPIYESETTAKLGALLQRHGSDKSTVHDYHRMYATIIAPRLTSKTAVHVLEIGIGSNNLDVPSNMGLTGMPGASLRAFRDLSPNVHVVGADVDNRILFQEERIETFQVDQTDKNSLAQLCASLGARKFDLIIDDGLHLPHANMNTLAALAPFLALDGVMVVEDINGFYSFWTVAAALLSREYDACFSACRSQHVFAIRYRQAAGATNEDQCRGSRHDG